MLRNRLSSATGQSRWTREELAELARKELSDTGDRPMQDDLCYAGRILDANIYEARAIADFQEGDVILLVDSEYPVTRVEDKISHVMIYFMDGMNERAVGSTNREETHYYARKRLNAG